MAKKRTRKALQQTAPPPPPPKTAWFERLPWQMGALALLVLLGYANSLGGQWVYDDVIIPTDPSVVGPGFGWRIFLLTQTRPLTFLTFHWNYLAAGQNPVSWHAVNILLHAANCALLLLLARRHFSSGTAFIAAALYAVHPLSTEVVSYVYQRSTALATLFALLSFLLFLKERYAWSVGAFALSMLCKEETIALPIFVLLYDVVYRRRRPRWGYYAAMLGVLGLAVAHAFHAWSLNPGDPAIGYRTKGVPALSFALTEPRVVWRYLRLFLLPIRQNVDHDVALSHGLFSPAWTLPALLGLAALVGVLAWLAWRGHRPAFWGLSFFILLAPTSSIVPVRDVMFEHRVYFPLTCLVIAVAGLLAQMPRRALVPTVTAILIGLLAATVARNRVWQDKKSLWGDAVLKSPNKARAYAALGRAWATDDPPRARQYLERARALEPDNPSIETDLGLASLFTKDGPAALQHFGRALALGGPTPDYLTNLGMVYQLQGQFDQAIDYFHRALQADPCMAKARAHLMRTLALQGKQREARAAGEVPVNCHLLPEEAQRLETIGRSLQ
ncbi:MAG TPA: tetratricopeptide repeat protein [Terriglobia bacterium]|nr:tetratricopeptide repeat protein [Terriglobia bacterium]